MFSFDNFKYTLSRSLLIAKKYSPEACVALGVVGVVATVVVASKATLSLDSTLKEAQKDVDRVKQAFSEGAEGYTEEMYQRDLAITYAKKAGGIIKLYAPSAVLGAVSIGLIVGSHIILKKRNAGLLAAYAVLSEGFSKYRTQILNEFGEEVEFRVRNGLVEETVTEEVTDEEGKTKKQKVKKLRPEQKYASQYAKWFDDSCQQWQRDPSLNLFFLKSQQNYMNDLLRVRGHVFLNEVYDAIGLPRTSDGALVGWVYGEGDNFVDFGIFDANDAQRDFVNGYANKILLDFNVDGVIYNLI